MKQSLGWVKALYIIMAILQIIAGIVFFMNPFTSEVVLGTFIGALMVVVGAMTVIAFFTVENLKSIWTILLGILMVALGFVIWNNLFDAMNIIGIFAGVGFLFSGVYKCVMSFKVKELGISGWLLILIGGIATCIVGGIMAFNPAISGTYFTIMIGATFLADGIADLMLGLMAF